MTPELDHLFVTTGSAIRRTMETIAAGGVELALVVDEKGCLAGTVSDGDVRRALLSGAGLEDAIGPHVQRSPVWVDADADRASVLDLMRSRLISQVPVLDTQGRVVGLHVLQQLLGAGARPNIAVIMAGGRGTRLQPLTDRVPKPMLRVAGRPILERIVLNLVGFGIRTVYLAVGYRGDIIEDHFGDGKGLGCEIRYLHEDPASPLGSGGALTLLPDEARSTTEPLVVMNGDLVTQFDLGRFLAAHGSSAYVATIGTREYMHEVPYGVLTAENGRLRRIEEKPMPTWLVNAGVYAIEPHLLERIPPAREFAMTDLVADCLGRGEPVGVHGLEGDWLDVGRIDDLRRARGDGL